MIYIRINLVPFRASRGPLFLKPVSWFGLFLPFLQTGSNKTLFWYTYVILNNISGGKNKHRHRDPRPPEPESPPCTCDEDTVAEADPMRPLSAFGFGAPSPRSPPGLGVPLAEPPWLDMESRDSKMSRATTTRTVASLGGFSSLASRYRS